MEKSNKIKNVRLFFVFVSQMLYFCSYKLIKNIFPY